jgi:hypothetical protein
MTQASVAPAKTRAQISERTLRKDPWWRAPRITATLLTIWVLYATVHVFLGKWYWVPQYHYLTPFYSPCISGECTPGSATLGTWFGQVPPIIPYALVSLPFVLGFRLTCYYYRRAYYRAFWRAPAACAVREPHASYSGETRFPLIMQNLHRYFFYLVLLISLLNTWDVIQAFRGPNGSFGLGLGTLIMLGNVILPLLPPHHRRAAEELLQAPGPILGVDAGLPAERQAHAAGLDHPGHADADRPVHLAAGRGRLP